MRSKGKLVQRSNRMWMAKEEREERGIIRMNEETESEKETFDGLVLLRET